MKIRDLRLRAEEELGQGFDLREFHDAVLSSGAVPLGILDTLVTEWIEQQRTDKRSL